MTRRQQRDEIETFCRNFLYGNNDQLNELIYNYRFILAQLDIQQIQFTQDTFDSSFKRICSEVFIHRPINNGYIIAILGFAKAINEYHYTSSWFRIDILIHSLISVLEGIDFHPDQLLLAPSASCILL